MATKTRSRKNRKEKKKADSAIDLSKLPAAERAFPPEKLSKSLGKELKVFWKIPGHPGLFRFVKNLKTPEDGSQGAVVARYESGESGQTVAAEFHRDKDIESMFVKAIG